MWFWYALAAAVFSGVSVTFNKRVLNRGVHSSIVSFFLFGFCTLVGLFFLIKEGQVKVDNIFFLASIVSAIVFSVAKTLSLNIFKQNNLSDIYPLASIAPLTLYILSTIFLGEEIKPTAIVGILIMTAGVYLLNFDKENKNIWHPFILLFKNRFAMLFVVALILSNISAIAEKTAINHTFDKNVFPLAFWENLFLTGIIGGYVVKTNKNWQTEIKTHFLSLFVAATIFTVLYFLVLLGFRDGPIALVSAIKKVEVIIVLIISYLFFKEKPSKYVYLGSLLMLIAVALIKL